MLRSQIQLRKAQKWGRKRQTEREGERDRKNYIVEQQHHAWEKNQQVKGENFLDKADTTIKWNVTQCLNSERLFHAPTRTLAAEWI